MTSKKKKITSGIGKWETNQRHQNLLLGTLFLGPGGCCLLQSLLPLPFPSNTITVLYQKQSSKHVLIELWLCHTFHTFALSLSYPYFTLLLPAVQQWLMWLWNSELFISRETRRANGSSGEKCWYRQQALDLLQHPWDREIPLHVCVCVCAVCV